MSRLIFGRGGDIIFSFVFFFYFDSSFFFFIFFFVINNDVKTQFLSINPG